MRRAFSILVLLLPAIAWAAAPSDSEFHWKGRVAPEKTVTIDPRFQDMLRRVHLDQ